MMMNLIAVSSVAGADAGNAFGSAFVVDSFSGVAQFSLGGMTTLFDILPEAEGAQLIRECWGDVPQFKHIEILHLKHTISAGMADVSVLAVFATYESDDLNECKPSKMVIQFFDVSRFEFVDGFGDHPAHGVKLDAIFASNPPAGVLAIDTRDGFYIACRRVQVVSCVHDPLTKILDKTDAAS